MNRSSKKLKTYAEKLKDPRWLKVREKVLRLWNHSCRECRSKDKWLQVHHRFYESGKEPWDYDLNDMVVLCKFCHLKRHAVEVRIQKLIGKLYFKDLCKLEENLERNPDILRPYKKEKEHETFSEPSSEAGQKMFNALQDALEL